MILPIDTDADDRAVIRWHSLFSAVTPAQLNRRPLLFRHKGPQCSSEGVAEDASTGPAERERSREEPVRYGVRTSSASEVAGAAAASPGRGYAAARIRCVPQARGTHRQHASKGETSPFSPRNRFHRNQTYRRRGEKAEKASRYCTFPIPLSKADELYLVFPADKAVFP